MKTETQPKNDLTKAEAEKAFAFLAKNVEQRKRKHLKKLNSMSKEEIVQLVLSLERAVRQKSDFLVELRDLVEEIGDEYFDTEFHELLLKESELNEKEYQFVIMTIDDIASNYHEQE